MSRPPRAPKGSIRPLSEQELEAKFQERVRLLGKATAEFDSGDDSELINIAHSIRVLCYDAPTSLLKHTGRDKQTVRSTALKGLEGSDFSFVALAGVGSGDPPIYSPIFDAFTGNQIPFPRWWSETVVVGADGAKFSRRDIVLAVANRDGGSHVDAGLDESYARISRDDSASAYRVAETGGPVKGVVAATLRQIAHELLTTFDPSIPKKSPGGSGSFEMGFSTSTTPPEWRVDNRQPCPCGSGQTFEDCHRAASETEAGRARARIVFDRYDAFRDAALRREDAYILENAPSLLDSVAHRTPVSSGTRGQAAQLFIWHGVALGRTGQMELAEEQVEKALRVVDATPALSDLRFIALMVQVDLAATSESFSKALERAQKALEILSLVPLPRHMQQRVRISEMCARLLLKLKRIAEAKDVARSLQVLCDQRVGHTYDDARTFAAKVLALP